MACEKGAAARCLQLAVNRERNDIEVTHLPTVLDILLARPAAQYGVRTAQQLIRFVMRQGDLQHFHPPD